MKIFDFLKSKSGSGSTPGDIGELESALVGLRQARDEATAELAQMAARRRELLLADAPEQDILAHDVKVDKQHISLERFDLAETELLSRLAAARSDEEEMVWRQFFEKYYGAAEAYGAALVKACKAFQRCHPMAKAVHEAGHAVVGLALGAPLRRLAVVDEDTGTPAPGAAPKFGGRTEFGEGGRGQKETICPCWRVKLMHGVLTCGGPAAERKFRLAERLPQVSLHTAQSDRNNMRALA
jgi:hypothetical protein